MAPAPRAAGKLMDGNPHVALCVPQPGEVLGRRRGSESRPAWWFTEPRPERPTPAKHSMETTPNATVAPSLTRGRWRCAGKAPGLLALTMFPLGSGTRIGRKRAKVSRVRRLRVQPGGTLPAGRPAGLWMPLPVPGEDSLRTTGERGRLVYDGRRQFVRHTFPGPDHLLWSGDLISGGRHRLGTVSAKPENGGSRQSRLSASP